jgi:hypothetical protein
MLPDWEERLAVVHALQRYGIVCLAGISLFCKKISLEIRDCNPYLILDRAVAGPNSEASLSMYVGTRCIPFYFLMHRSFPRIISLAKRLKRRNGDFTQVINLPLSHCFLRSTFAGFSLLV